MPTRQTRKDAAYFPRPQDEHGEIAESRGIRLSGRVWTREEEVVAPHVPVYLSILGKPTGSSATTPIHPVATFFLPDLWGEKQIFLSATRKGSAELILAIDPDFCSAALQLPSPELAFDSASLEAIRRLSIQFQLQGRYGMTENPSPSPAPMDEVPSGSFYGPPSSVVSFDDFIRLPTMEEYFNEVVPSVSLRRTGGEQSLRVLGPHPDLDIYPPLVMIDGVAIHDLASILAVSPRQIERIEVVEAPYVVGNLIFGGIVQIFSRNQDLASIRLPDSGLLVQYATFESEAGAMGPPSPGPEPMPDLRNTIYWNPGIRMDPDAPARIRFVGPERVGDYLLRIRGIDQMGIFREIDQIIRVQD
ncbi:MAG: hypothetical protein R2751_02550 [Bacteroidales bacterium]